MLGEEPSLRRQLLDAKARIAAQLDEIYDRANGIGIARRGGPPDYSEIQSKLENELQEIDDLLNKGDRYGT